MDQRGRVFGFGSEVVDGGDDAGRVEMPFDEETIGGHAAVKRTGGDAVEIGDVSAGEGAETIEIKVSVFGFDGVESPFNETDAATECVFALKKFEEAAYAAIAMGRQNRGHVGMEIGSVIVNTHESFGKADHGVGVEGAENLAAGMDGDDVSDVGLGVKLGVGPDFAGNGHAAVEFVESVEWADGDVGHESFQL